jgi:hypothetical protein
VVSTDKLQFNFRSPQTQRVRSVPSTGPIAGILAEERRQDERLRRKRRAERRASRHPLDQHSEPSSALLEAWAPVEDLLRQEIDEQTFRMWFADLHPHRLVNGAWVLASANRYAVSWVPNRFGRLVESCAGRPVEYVMCAVSR